jgi:CubicO group peptidase (beta-lactamase class C family)
MAISDRDLTVLREQLEEKVAGEARRLNVPGVAVGVWAGGEEQYVCHGVTSIESPVAVDEHTLFQIGSTGKTFTASAIMRLVERGRVDLGAPVRTYLPGLKLKDEDVAARVTVLHLLNHTAGWNGDFFEDTGWGDDALARYVDKMAELDQVSPLGATASYNNAALALAGRVIEVVTGQTYEDAIRELLLEPLGMRESFFHVNDVMTRRYATGHVNRDAAIEVARPWKMPRSSSPMGGLVSTARDQVRWARFHLGDGTARGGDRVLARESLDRMKQPTASLDGNALGDYVGISWLLRDVGGVRVVAHGGTTHGQLSAFQMVPERGFAITVLTNATNGGQLHGAVVKWALEAYVGAVQPEPEPLALTADELAPYAGTYRTDNGRVEVVVEGDRLVATPHVAPEVLRKIQENPPDPRPIPLKLLADDRFVIVDGPGKGGRGYFARQPGGAIRGLNVGGRLALRVET